MTGRAFSVRHGPVNAGFLRRNRLYIVMALPAHQRKCIDHQVRLRRHMRKMTQIARFFRERRVYLHVSYLLSSRGMAAKADFIPVVLQQSAIRARVRLMTLIALPDLDWNMHRLFGQPAV
jgi:hypothetical protein